MFIAYKGRGGRLCLRPVDPQGEEDLEEIVRRIKQDGLDAIDIETEMPEEEFHKYRQYEQRRKQSEYDGSGAQAFGFSASYMPQYPDYGPQAHWHNPLPWWTLLPLIFERGGGQGGRGGDQGGQGGGFEDGRGGRGGNRGFSSERGNEGENENPRDTGRRDMPRR